MLCETFDMIELIKNVFLIIVSVLGSFGLIVLYFKIFFVSKEIKKTNKEIEEIQIEVDKYEINSIGPYRDLDILGERKKCRRSLEQKIQRLQERKKCLLEEISIYKILKKI